MVAFSPCGEVVWSDEISYPRFFLRVLGGGMVWGALSLLPGLIF